MLPREEARRLFALALSEFAPEWEVVGEMAEVTIRDSNHWLSGAGTFAATLRHRASGAAKMLGRRAGGEAGCAYHRGVSFLVLEAYAERNTDPVRRYLEEIGVTPGRPVPRTIPLFRV